MDEVDAFDRTEAGKENLASDKANNNKKWQSLTSVAPHPEEDNDPFALGDDDEGNDKTEDLRKDDSDRLKDAARASVSAGASGPAGEGLKLQPSESETSGTKNKEAEELLGGAKKE